ncbi:M10 family metallopeptidase C-terminal domain-containing protein [Microvirga aerilata]|uniref:M10 family metallopeptidase C-terminal domain-containing protein n=1 Tax=Microvirga aerilata TaxID=670292 RepID=UPI00364226A3
MINLGPGETSQIAGRTLVIAADTLIENAIAGDGSDLLIGNSADNSLWGMRGNDTFHGGRE